MSSVEIAERTGKDHDNVRRDIQKMEKAPSLNFEEKSLPSTGGRPTKAYSLSRREVDILHTGYSIPLRAALVELGSPFP